MENLEHLEQQVTALTTKLDTLIERSYRSALSQQEALAALRNELTSVSHCFGALNQDVERSRYQVWGNPSGGLLDRVAKLEYEALRQAESRKRNLAAVWTVLGGVVLYSLTTLLGKVL